MKRRFCAVLFGLVLLLCSLNAQAASNPNLPRSQAAISMMECLEKDPELKALMEKSIAKAQKNQSGPEYQPGA